LSLKQRDVIIYVIGTPIPKIELLTEEYVAYLSDLRVPEEKGEALRRQATDLPAEEKRTFLDTVVKALEDLKEKEVAAIDRNLRETRMRMTRILLDMLRKQLEERFGLEQGEGSFHERLIKEWEHHPVRTTVTGAALVLGVLTVGSWIAKRFKEATHAGREAMQTTGSWIKRTLIATGVALGVFLGIKAYKEYKWWKQKAESLPGLGGLFGFGKPPEEPRHEPPKPEPHFTPPSPEPAAPPQPTVPDVVSDGGEIIKHETIAATARGLLFLHRSISEEELGITDDNRRNIVISALENLDQSIPVQKFLDTKAERGAIDNLGARGDNAFAFLFLARVVQEHEEMLRRMWQREGKEFTGRETIGAILTRMSEGPRVVSRLFDALKGKDAREMDVMAMFADVFGERGHLGERNTRGLEILHNPSFVRRITALVPEVQSRREQFALFCAEHRLSTTKDFLQNYARGGFSEHEVDARALRAVILESTSPRMRQYLLLYTHRGVRESPIRDEAARALERSLDNMRVDDALQIFAYADMVQSNVPHQVDSALLREGDPMKVLLLQLKVMQLVGREDDPKRNYYPGKDFRNSLLVDALDADVEINLPAFVRDALMNVVTWAGEEVCNAWLAAWDKAVEEAYSAYKAWAEKNPGLADALETTGTVVGVGGGATMGTIWTVKFVRWLQSTPGKSFGLRLTSLSKQDPLFKWGKNPLRWPYRTLQWTFTSSLRESAINEAHKLALAIRRIDKAIRTFPKKDVGPIRAAFNHMNSRWHPLGGYHEASFARVEKVVESLRNAPRQ
jgi:hypothetical protein